MDGRRNGCTDRRGRLNSYLIIIPKSEPKQTKLNRFISIYQRNGWYESSALKTTCFGPYLNAFINQLKDS